MTDDAKDIRKKRGERLRRGLQNPMSRFHIEVDIGGGGLSVFLSGVHTVVDFSSERVEMKTEYSHIKITGERLVLSVFENHTAQISGRVEEIGFVRTEDQ